MSVWVTSIASYCYLHCYFSILFRSHVTPERPSRNFIHSLSGLAHNYGLLIYGENFSLLALIIHSRISFPSFGSRHSSSRIFSRELNGAANVTNDFSDVRSSAMGEILPDVFPETRRICRRWRDLTSALRLQLPPGCLFGHVAPTAHSGLPRRFSLTKLSAVLLGLPALLPRTHQQGHICTST